MSKANTQYQQQLESKKLIINKKLKTISSMNANIAQSISNTFDNSLISKKDIFIQNPNSYIEDRPNEQQIILTQLSKPSKLQTEVTKVNKVQSEINQISRMKMLFQSRINTQKNQSKNHTQSIDRSIDKSPHTKSIQKHILKPSAVPNFINKNFNPNIAKNTNKEQDYSQNKKIDVQFSKIPLKQSLKKQNLFPSSDKKTIFQCSEISSMFGDFDFESETRGTSNDIMQQNKELFQNNPKVIRIDSAVQKSNFSSSKQKIIQQNCLSKSEVITESNCKCEHLLKDFMQQTANKMAQITERLMLLQNQNARLKKLEDKVNQNTKLMQLYKQQAESAEYQCDQLKETNFAQQVQKEELQSLLKDMLFKRQKEKFYKTPQYSKENTQRSQFDSQFSIHTEKSQNRNILSQIKDQQNIKDDFSQQLFVNNTGIDGNFKKELSSSSKREIEGFCSRGMSGSNERSTKNEGRQQKHVDSKTKVQNLLSKIQIKIQKN